MTTTTILYRNDDSGKFSGKELAPTLPQSDDPDHKVIVLDGDKPGHFQVDFVDDSIRYDVDKTGGAQ
jgi:hypothetical protein